MCFFKPPKPPKPEKLPTSQTQAYLMRREELARAGTGSSQTTNPTGALGVPNASVTGKYLTA